MERNTSHSLDHHPEDPSEEFSDTPLDIFYLYWGVLRSSIVQVSPQMKWVLLGTPPPNQKRDPEMTSRPNPESE